MNSANVQKALTRLFRNQLAPDWATHILRIGEGEDALYFWEEGVGQENGKRYQAIRLDAEVLAYASYTNRDGVLLFELPAEHDDELPEVLAHYSYLSQHCGNMVNLEMRKPADAEGVIVLTIDGVYRRVRLTAETAKAMSADLFRMARELEREDF